MNKEEKAFFKALENVMAGLANAIENQVNRKPDKPPILFAGWCDWCSKDTVHRSLLRELHESGYPLVAASTTEIFNYVEPLHICLCCGNTKYKD